MMSARLEHDPEKAWPGLDPGWIPVFGKEHAPTITSSGMTMRRKVITLYEHDPEKWIPVFGKDHAPTIT